MDAEHTQADRMLSFLAWVEVNKKRLITWGVTALVVAVAVVAFINYQSQKEQRASEALSNVRMPLNPATPVPPGTADAYLKVAKEHAGTKAGARALLLAASTKFVEGGYADSQKLFEQFIREFPDNKWLAQAHYGIAAALEAQQKPNEAIAKYEEVRRRFASDPVIDNTKMALGKLYQQQNKPAEALKLYDEILAAGSFSDLSSEARVRRDELLKQHPELAPVPTNPPPAAVTMPTTGLTNRTITFSNVIQKPATNAPAAAPTPKPATNGAPPAAPAPAATPAPVPAAPKK